MYIQEKWTIQKSFTKLAIESDKRVRQKKSEKELTEGAIAKIDEANVDLELKLLKNNKKKNFWKPD